MQAVVGGLLCSLIQSLNSPLDGNDDERESLGEKREGYYVLYEASKLPHVALFGLPSKVGV